MSKIAKTANVSPATIYLYFENKQDLVNQTYLEVNSKYTDFVFKTYTTNTSVIKGFFKRFNRTKIDGLPNKVKQFIGNSLKLGHFKNDFAADEDSICIDFSRQIVRYRKNRVSGIRVCKPILHFKR